MTCPKCHEDYFDGFPHACPTDAPPAIHRPRFTRKVLRGLRVLVRTAAVMDQGKGNKDDAATAILYVQRMEQWSEARKAVAHT